MSDSSFGGLVAVTSALPALSIVAVCLRFYARRRQSRQQTIADWMTGAALVSYIVAAGCVFALMHEKMLGSEYQTPSEGIGQLSTEIKITYREALQLSLFFIKLSAVFFYRSIFCVPGQNRIFNVVTIITEIILVLWLVVFGFLTGFQCGTHIQAIWDGDYARYCILSFPYLYGWCIVELLLDIWVLVLPIPSILRLHANMTTRLSIVGVFLLAFIGLGACIFRMVPYIQIETLGESFYLHHNEERALTSVFFLDMLETGMSLVAVNLPILWSLLSFRAPKVTHRDHNPNLTSEDIETSTNVSRKINESGGACSSLQEPRQDVIDDNFLGYRSEARATRESEEESDNDQHNWRPPSRAIKVRHVVEVRHGQ